MKILIVSSSHDPNSRSEQLARLCGPLLDEAGVEHSLLRLKDYPLPPYLSSDLAIVPGYPEIHQFVPEAQARLKKSLEVTVELAQLLSQRTYSSGWEI